MAKHIAEHGPSVPKKVDRRKGASIAAPGVTFVGPYDVRWKIQNVKKKLRKAPSEEGVVSKRLRDSNGKISVYRFIDANSASFGSDFDNVFRSNVRKARRANKRVVGVPDGGNKA